MSHEEIQQALDQFAAAENKQMTETLLFPIREIARTGSVCNPVVIGSYKWQSLVGVILYQLRMVLQCDPGAQRSPGEEEPAGLSGDGSYEESCTRLYGLLQSFEGPPFTIQRICELLLQPHQHHKTKRKLLYALDKLLSVTTILAEQSWPPPLAEIKLSNHAGDTEATDISATGFPGETGASRLDRGIIGDTMMSESIANGSLETCAPAQSSAGTASSGGTDEGSEHMQTESRAGADSLEDSAMAA